MFCPNCGKELPDNAKFCDSCGANLSENAQSDNSQSGNAQSDNTQNGNAQNNTSAPFVNNEPAKISERNIAVAIILSLVTCGIYSIYWFICLANEVNKVSNHENDTSGGIAFLLGMVTCGIYLFFWAYKAGEKVDEAKRIRGLQSSNSGVLYLILSLLGLQIVAFALMQNELNQMARL